MALTHQTRQHYWQHWQEFLPTSFDLYLKDLDPSEQIFVIQGFAKWVRDGACGRGKQVKVGSVQTAIGTTTKVIELAGFANPLHWPGTTNYHAGIALQMESYH